MREKHFSSNDEVIAAVVDYFAELPENHYKNGIHKLEKRWHKCIELLEEYTVNKKHFNPQNRVFHFYSRNLW